MNEIWVNRLIAGDRTWDQMPAFRQNAVKALLAVKLKDGVITEERYEEITGGYGE